MRDCRSSPSAFSLGEHVAAARTAWLFEEYSLFDQRLNAVKRRVLGDHGERISMLIAAFFAEINARILRKHGLKAVSLRRLASFAFIARPVATMMGEGAMLGKSQPPL